MRGFRNVGLEQAVLIAMLGGDEVGDVTWSQSLLDATESKGIKPEKDVRVVLNSDNGG